MQPTIRHGISVTVVLAVVAGTWQFGKPWLAKELEAEFDRSTSELIREAIAPTNRAFRAIIRANIEAINVEIRAMAFRRDRDPNWSLEDEIEYDKKVKALEIQAEAMAAIGGTIP